MMLTVLGKPIYEKTADMRHLKVAANDKKELYTFIVNKSLSI